MLPTILIAISLLGAPVLPGEESHELLVPADLIQQLFSDHVSQKSLRKRPFNLSELQSLLTDPWLGAPPRATEITRRYLAITYPAGPTSALDVADSSLPEEVKELLFKAKESSARFSLPSDLEQALDLLTGLSPKLRRALLDESPPSISIDTVNLEELLMLGESRFSRLVPFYRSTVSMADEHGTSYLLSTPGRDHLLARLLEVSGSTGATCSATLESCNGTVCRTPSVGASFASFSLEQQGVWMVRAGDSITARCIFSTVLRRVYAEGISIEYSFEECDLLTVNGKKPAVNPLLEELRRVQ